MAYRRSAAWVGQPLGIRASRLIAPSIRGINESLIGEIELGSPVHGRTTRYLCPALVNTACDVVAIAPSQQLARNIDEVFQVIRPAKSARQFEIAGDAVVGLAKRSIGSQHIWILAEKIIMPLIIKSGYGIRVDIGQFLVGVPPPVAGLLF